MTERKRPDEGRWPTLRGLDLEDHLRNPAIRQRYVTTLFDLVAPRYDRFTRVFSFGMDRGWKRQLVAWLASFVPRDGIVLDLACGTGDLALAAAALVPDGRVTGVDGSVSMIKLARARSPQPRSGRIDLFVGDMVHVPVRDASVDAVTVGYGFRNIWDRGAALDEIGRALKPGGGLLTLDFYRPSHAVWRGLFLHYLRFAGNVVGWLWHREPVAYGYIAASIEHFMSHEAFSTALHERGFVVERVRPKLWGGICLHLARKAQDGQGGGANLYSRVVAH